MANLEDKSLNEFDRNYGSNEVRLKISNGRHGTIAPIMFRPKTFELPIKRHKWSKQLLEPFHFSKSTLPHRPARMTNLPQLRINATRSPVESRD